MDSEKQKDEILALESIYNEEEFSYCSVDDLYEITLKIFISLPEDYFFTYNDDDDDNSENQDDSKEVRKVRISHLPPLTLCVTLPGDYPSASPPKFSLRCSWLRKVLISRLCKELDRLWELNQGQEILFTWISFLQSETLAFLNIKESIDMNFAHKVHKKRLENAQKKQEVASSTDDAASAKEHCRTSESRPEKCKDKRTMDHQRRQRKQCFSKKQSKVNKNKNWDKRAYCDVFVSNNPIRMLMDYSKMRNEIEFRKSFYSCKICFTDKSGEHCIQFLPCEHVFCKECIAGYFESRIKEGAVQNIRCPDEGCLSEALPNQIKDLMSPELFSQYDTLLLTTTLDTMSDIIYCPRKFCQYPVSREQNELMARCPMCEYTFCILCKAVYHGVEPCKVDSEEKRNLIKEYQEASAERKNELEQRYGKKQLQMFVDNAMSENWIEKNSQSCPKCNAAIEKSDGCNKMTCWKCKTYFCWICKVKLNNKNPYDHYNDPNSECYRRLYQGLIANADDEEDFIDEENDFVDDGDDLDDIYLSDEYDWFSDEDDDLYELYEI